MGGNSILAGVLDSYGRHDCSGGPLPSIYVARPQKKEEGPQHTTLL